MQFRATYHPVQYIENKINELFPELEAQFAVYKKDQEFRVSHDGALIPLNETDKIMVQKWRSKTVSYSWIRPEDFPWTEKSDLGSQLQMSDEYENRMLLLCFVAKEDKMKNIIGLCFPRETKFFGLQKQLQEFTTDEKAIIGEIFHKLLGFEYQQALTERESLLKMSRYQQLKQQTETQGNDHFYEKYFLNVCSSILQELNTEENNFIIEPEAHGFLAQQCQDPEELKLIIAEAAELSLMLSPESGTYTLTRLHFASLLNAVKTNASPLNQDQKVTDLLNRYEDAAIRAAKNGFAINGKNVARFLIPVISPPAISDSLKKHAAKIEKMLKEHPYEWKLIRQSLKPLREIDGFKNLKISV